MIDEYIKNNQEIDPQTLKQDVAFQEQLKNQIKDAKDSNNIVELYNVLDILIFIEDDKEIDDIYQLIYKFAMDYLNTILEQGKILDLENDVEYAVSRAIYETAIELYSNNNFKSAKELFLILSIITDIDFYVGAMQIHMLAALKKIPFDTFMNDFVDTDKIENSDYNAYFIAEFKDYGADFLEKYSDDVREEILSISKFK